MTNEAEIKQTASSCASSGCSGGDGDGYLLTHYSSALENAFLLQHTLCTIVCRRFRWGISSWWSRRCLLDDKNILPFFPFLRLHRLFSQLRLNNEIYVDEDEYEWPTIKFHSFYGHSKIHDLFMITDFLAAMTYWLFEWEVVVMVGIKIKLLFAISLSKTIMKCPPTLSTPFSTSTEKTLLLEQSIRHVSIFSIWQLDTANCYLWEKVTITLFTLRQIFCCAQESCITLICIARPSIRKKNTDCNCIDSCKNILLDMRKADQETR